MAEIATIQIRRGTAAQWTAANPILANGEPIIVTDTGRIKYGDGSTPFINLPYADTKIPTATTTQAGLMTAADKSQINTNKDNIATQQTTINTLKTTVGGHTTAINGHTTSINSLGSAVDTLSLLPKAITNCVRLYLPKDDNGVGLPVYTGNPDYIQYLAVNSMPIDPPMASELRLDTKDEAQYVDFVFRGGVNNGTIPDKAFNQLPYNNINAVLVIPDYVLRIIDTALDATKFDAIYSLGVTPPHFKGNLTANGIFVHNIALPLYTTAWNDYANILQSL